MKPFLAILLLTLFVGGLMPVFLNVSPVAHPIDGPVDVKPHVNLPTDQYIPVGIIEKTVFRASTAVPSKRKIAEVPTENVEFGLSFVGVTQSGTLTTAIFVSRDGSDKVQLKTGQTYAGWTLEKITFSTVSLSQGDELKTIKLFASSLEGKN